jgi:hypothetical protein
MIKNIWLIQNIEDGKFLCKYRSHAGFFKKAIFNTETGAKHVIDTEIKNHWLLGRHQWQTFKIGEEWKNPEFINL